MLTFNFNFKFNNFFKKKENEINKLYNASKAYNLSVLPISPNYNFDNLFPITNHVEFWSTFIIGSDKSYILCNVGDSYIKFENKDIVNTKGAKIPKDLFEFLNNVWDISLGGKNLQFFIVLDSHLYIFNSYCLKNEQGIIIGCTGFMRNFESIKVRDDLINPSDI
jgi:hypothetical protein